MTRPCGNKNRSPGRRMNNAQPAGPKVHVILTDEQLGSFRTELCEGHQHGSCTDSDSCPNSHCLTWQRRSPFKAPHYAPKLCPEIQFLKKGAKMVLVRRCNKGRMCQYAHSKEEELYHPLMYKTKPCNAYPSCNRSHCPFVHSEEERRRPFSNALVRAIWGTTEIDNFSESKAQSSHSEESLDAVIASSASNCALQDSRIDGSSPTFRGLVQLPSREGLEPQTVLCGLPSKADGVNATILPQRHQLGPLQNAIPPPPPPPPPAGPSPNRHYTLLPAVIPSAPPQPHSGSSSVYVEGMAIQHNMPPMPGIIPIPPTSPTHWNALVRPQRAQQRTSVLPGVAHGVSPIDFTPHAASIAELSGHRPNSSSGLSPQFTTTSLRDSSLGLATAESLLPQKRCYTAPPTTTADEQAQTDSDLWKYLEALINAFEAGQTAAADSTPHHPNYPNNGHQIHAAADQETLNFVPAATAPRSLMNFDLQQSPSALINCVSPSPVTTRAARTPVDNFVSEEGNANRAARGIVDGIPNTVPASLDQIPGGWNRIGASLSSALESHGSIWSESGSRCSRSGSNSDKVPRTLATSPSASTDAGTIRGSSSRDSSPSGGGNPSPLSLQQVPDWRNSIGGNEYAGLLSWMDQQPVRPATTTSDSDTMWPWSRQEESRPFQEMKLFTDVQQNCSPNLMLQNFSSNSTPPASSSTMLSGRGKQLVEARAHESGSAVSTHGAPSMSDLNSFLEKRLNSAVAAPPSGCNFEWPLALPFLPPQTFRWDT